MDNEPGDVGRSGPSARGDEFEARHMHDGAPIVHRDKRVSRGMAALLTAPGVFVAALAVLVAVANGSSSRPVPAAALPLVVAAMGALSLMFIAMGLVFAVVRTLVTEEAVHVKYGLWGPRIALGDIESCAVVEYDWTEFGGWGIRRGRGGTWAYVPAGGPVLEIRYRDGGEQKRVLVGVTDPAEAARQIDRARRVRVVVEGGGASMGTRAEEEARGLEPVEPAAAASAERARSPR